MTQTELQKLNGGDGSIHFMPTGRTVPCPDCGSKKAYQPHDDDGGYCFKCNEKKSGQQTLSKRTHYKQNERPPEDIATIWRSGRPILGCGHGYLHRKGGLTGFGLRKCKDKLLAPIREINGDLVSIQFITPAGQKKLARGCHLDDGFFSLGKFKRRIYICEGVATALTIYSATNEFTVAAVSAGRLLRVAKIIRAAYPDADITICADNDGD